ncbi:uncharacterized protein LOC124101929 isoform X2 [Marmota monax]|uniref:uncharacterized protein LOC124101929 isoform X2 n=1 Tax=Marmota monax TaxID=9995 RepID=UPI001EB04748|nr:uncharacterized protein LOC124101929 isoform X2 [Marmota monax]
MMNDFSDQHLLSSLAHRNPYSQGLKMILMTSVDTEYALASWRKRQDKSWLYIYCTNMAVFFSPSPDGGAEMNLDGEPQMKLKEIIRGLQAELQEHKLNFRDLEEKFILCQTTLYTLANQFQKYRSGAEEESGKEQELLAPSLRQAPQEEKEILQDVLNEGCNTCPSHSESSDIHQPPCFSADLLEHHDNEDNDKEESLYFSWLSSLSSDLQEEEENDLQLDEKHFRYSGHPDSCDTQELVRSSVFPSHEPKVSCTVDGTKLNLDTCIELQNLPTLGGDALGGLAVKTPGCELHVLTDTRSAVKQKIMKRKQLFCKWRMACRFPVLQASENHENDDEKDQNSLNSSIPNGELQEEKEDDLLLGKTYFIPSDHPNSSNTQELVRSSVFPSAEPKVSSAVDEAKHVLNDATGVGKEKIIIRKILMSKRKLACRFPGLQASELDSNDPSGMKNSLKLEGDSMDGSFANKHGRHIIGHINDYTALREQIGEGKQLVEKIQSLLRPTCNFLGLEAQSSEAPGSKCFHELRSSTCALHHTLEESALLLTMFWRATLPSFHGPGLPGKVDETMERELLDLRAQVSKQEKLLESTAEHLKSVNQQKENMEQFIVSQLTRTHDVLKKARTNLELRQRLHLTQSHSLLQIHHSLTSDL